MHVYLSVIMDIPSVPNQPKTFKFPQRSFGKTNPVKRSFQASWFTNRTPSDETYRGVEIVVHSLVVGLETRLNTAT